jgi:bacterioferritin (cytochrome b1)
MDKVLTEAHIELEAAAVLVQRVILLTQYPVLQVAEALVKHQLLQDHPV